MAWVLWWLNVGAEFWDKNITVYSSGLTVVNSNPKWSIHNRGAKKSQRLEANLDPFSAGNKKGLPENR
jgi:hypothetical protein